MSSLENILNKLERICFNSKKGNWETIYAYPPMDLNSLFLSDHLSF